MYATLGEWALTMESLHEPLPAGALSGKKALTLAAARRNGRSPSTRRIRTFIWRSAGSTPPWTGTSRARMRRFSWRWRPIRRVHGFATLPQ